MALLGFLAGCAKSSPPSDSASRSAAASTNAASVAPSAGPWFDEVSAPANLIFKHSSGHRDRFYMPEMSTGGVGLLDYDGDGLLDVFCVNGGSLYPDATNRPGNRLFHNLGHWKFEDVTGRAGVMGHGDYGMGCACADYDGDGRVDIYVTNLGTNILYHNNGDGTFTDVTRAAHTGGRGAWGTSCAFYDYDGDGHLDLFIANYLNWSRDSELNCYSRGGQPDYCSPLNYKAPAMDTLLHNKGDGTFEDVTLAAGLDKAYGNGLGIVFGDFDHDGRPDIF
ncbi:MAG: VCBS repeat-containing protein, partial [Verrucomicrobia bacterium]|nr:VCBS repeat-containing protein [Verrucomicrobiota bacterium]